MYLLGGDNTCALEMVKVLLNKCTPVYVKKKICPPPRECQQQRFAGNDLILWISVTFQGNFVASCKSALYHRHQTKKVDTSGWGSTPRKTSVTRGWMEMHQQITKTVKTSLHSSLSATDVTSSAVFSFPCCNVVPLLFVYALIPILVLSGCGNLNVHSWNCGYVCGLC